MPPRIVPSPESRVPSSKGRVARSEDPVFGLETLDSELATGR
jgi:hypothetical protein